MLKTLAFVHRNDSRFAVGDFYPVLSVFSHHELGTTTSPFLLLDHLGPTILPARSHKKGVNAHPHRGFETVTMMYQGELQHQDSTGAGGVIAAGDVQWMTAGAGVVHKEEFSPKFREQGGRFEMIQLWVNLPAQFKLVPPRYQSLLDQHIPVVKLANGLGQVRIIAGAYQGKVGPAQTYSAIQILDISLKAGQSLELPALHGDTTMIYLRSGLLGFENEAEQLDAQGLAVMSSLGENLKLHVLQDSAFILFNGTPLHEPLVAHGPFVMNTQDEIVASYDAFKIGNFGKTE